MKSKINIPTETARGSDVPGPGLYKTQEIGELAALRAQEAVYSAASQVTVAFLGYGGELIKFEKDEHWTWIVDPIASETSPAPIYYKSFDKWLRGQSGLSYSMARLAMQVVRRLYLEASIPLEELSKIDIGKYTAIMPEIEKIKAKPWEEICQERGVKGPDPKTLQDYAEAWKREQVNEWVAKASAEGSTRQELLLARTEADGWDVMFSGWMNIGEDFDPDGWVKMGVMERVQDGYWADGGSWLNGWSSESVYNPEKGAVYVTVKRRVSGAEMQQKAQDKKAKTETQEKQDEPKQEPGLDKFSAIEL